jgi:hypothetical protein
MRIIILIISAILIFSCHSTKNLKGQVYELSDGEQKIQLNFLTAKHCRIEQSYKCEKLPDTFSYLTLEAKYHIVKHKLKYLKNKSLTADLVVVENSDPNSKTLPNYTYIPDYEKLCLPQVTVNSTEYKIRQKLIPGVILNLVKDTLLIKNDTIIFGYKKIPRKL